MLCNLTIRIIICRWGWCGLTVCVTIKFFAIRACTAHIKSSKPLFQLKLWLVPYVTHGYNRCFLHHMFKKGLANIILSDSVKLLFPGFACPTRVKTLVNACKLPCFPASTQGFLVPGLLTPTSIFGMNQRDARRLAVRGENCLFWPLS